MQKPKQNINKSNQLLEFYPVSFPLETLGTRLRMAAQSPSAWRWSWEVCVCSLRQPLCSFGSSGGSHGCFGPLFSPLWAGGRGHWRCTQKLPTQKTPAHRSDTRGDRTPVYGRSPCSTLLPLRDFFPADLTGTLPGGTLNTGWGFKASQRPAQKRQGGGCGGKHSPFGSAFIQPEMPGISRLFLLLEISKC